MKILNIITLMLLQVIYTSNLGASEQYSFGVGLGSSYSGLGINASQLSDNDMKYISTGCVSFSSKEGSACGIGLGWITSRFSNGNNNKHGLGVYVGVIGTEKKLDDNKPLYGFGLGYHYFFNGIAKSGTNLGFSLLTGNGDSGRENVLMLQVGYQF